MKRTSTVLGNCSKEDSKNKRDALCKLLYTRLFDWIIAYVNSIISKEKKTYSRIGLLDIYGFEILDVNSLEQLCINFANEKLQQLYVHQYLQVRSETAPIRLWNCTLLAEIVVEIIIKTVA